MSINNIHATQHDNTGLSRQPDTQEPRQEERIQPVLPIAMEEPLLLTAELQIQHMAGIANCDFYLKPPDLLHHSQTLVALVKHKLDLLEQSIEQVSTYKPTSPGVANHAPMTCLQHRKCQGAAYSSQTTLTADYRLTARRLSGYLCDLEKCLTCYNTAVFLCKYDANHK